MLISIPVRVCAQVLVCVRTRETASFIIVLASTGSYRESAGWSCSAVYKARRQQVPSPDHTRIPPMQCQTASGTWDGDVLALCDG